MKTLALYMAILIAGGAVAQSNISVNYAGKAVKGAVVTLSDGQTVKTDAAGSATIEKNVTVTSVTYKDAVSMIADREKLVYTLVPSEKQLLRIIKAEPSIANCELFVANYGASKHVQVVVAKLQELEFVNASEKVAAFFDESAMTAFLAKYPGSDYAKRGVDMIDALAWQKAKKANNEAAYAAYIEMFPNGLAVKAAQEKMAMLK